MHVVKSQKTVCWLRACLTRKVTAMQENQIQRLHFLFVTRSPKMQDVSLDFEEFFQILWLQEGAGQTAQSHQISHLLL